jgi:hypothetical protein
MAITITLGAGNDELRLFQTIGPVITITDFVTDRTRSPLWVACRPTTRVMANFVRITTNAAGHHVVEINQDGQGRTYRGLGGRWNRGFDGFAAVVMPPQPPRL